MNLFETLRIKLYRAKFEIYCKEGTRPYLYNLERTASGEYVSIYTEQAWKNYQRGVEDALSKTGR